MNKQPCLYSIDNGNTHPHIAQFQEGKLLKLCSLNQFDFSIINPEDKVIISSVSKDLHIPKHITLIDIPNFKNDIFLDMPVKYEETLGVDRLFQSYYLYKRYEGKKILLIDSGTFTTFDFIERTGFRGGYIFPGPQTILNSYGQGKNLPLLKINKTYIKTEISQTTNKAIYNACNLFNQNLIPMVLNKREFDHIILTGGYSEYIHSLIEDSKLKSDIRIEKDLIHHSLEFISRQLSPF